MPNDTEVEISRCLLPAVPMIPRLGISRACLLEYGHEGEHMPGGICVAHGEYIGEQCPFYPECGSILVFDEAHPNGEPQIRKGTSPRVTSLPGPLTADEAVRLRNRAELAEENLAEAYHIARNLADAIQAFRNLPMLRKMSKLRATEEFGALCLAWEKEHYITDAFPDAVAVATEKAMAEFLEDSNKKKQQ